MGKGYRNRDDGTSSYDNGYLDGSLEVEALRADLREMTSLMEEHKESAEGQHALWKEHYDENEQLRERVFMLEELARDLRSYTHEWDWKYGEEWDAILAPTTQEGDE